MACRMDRGFRSFGCGEVQSGQETPSRVLRLIPHLFFATVPYATSTIPTASRPKITTREIIAVFSLVLRRNAETTMYGITTNLISRWLVRSGFINICPGQTSHAVCKAWFSITRLTGDQSFVGLCHQVGFTYMCNTGDLLVASSLLDSHRRRCTDGPRS